MLSQSVDYALRAMIYLANENPESRTVGQIAAVTQVPRPYLSKLMQNIAKAGLVRSQRGLHGGYMLAKDPEKTTILDVVNAVDPLERIRKCPLGIKTHGANLCPLHRRLDDAIAGVESAFRKTTLAEIIAEPSRSVPLCKA